MILIIGGYAAGKRSYAREVLGYTDAQMTSDLHSDLPVVYDAQDLAVHHTMEELLALLTE